ncbi:MAG: FAD-dependent oxidoreductase [Clostridia bacterium]|nr:FAD-dependent oxidoreductase [Clostridia bacterium]
MNSLWLDFDKKTDKCLPLSSHLETDVCIIGSGIFGLTCAYFLSHLGFRVTVLDKSGIGEKTTGHTTAKITSQHNLFYNYLIHSFGKKFASDYLQVNEKAIESIKNIIDTEKIKCDFEYQNSYVYTTKKSELNAIKKEVSSVEALGFPCEFVTKTGLPFEIEGAICFKNQAQFHPLKYLYGLANSILSHNGEIYANTVVTNIEKNMDETYLVITNQATVKSKFVIVASHYPFINFPGFYFLKMYQSTSYLIAVDTKKTLFNGMYINSSSPTFSYRTVRHNGKELLLIGGGDHKTGQPSCYQDTYGMLEQEAKKFYPNCEVLYRWNTRDCISLDKLPFIGQYSSVMPNVFVGTGFKKWGMTLSNVAANIVTDLICDKDNKYEYLFRPSRLKPIKNRDEMKNVLVQSTNSLVLNKFRPANMNFDEIANDSGSIIEIHNEKVGIYKSPTGKVFAVKPVCTHLGCLLSWNDVDKTWDCPCHGSRFDYKGKNLYDPAFKDLDTYNIE